MFCIQDVVGNCDVDALLIWLLLYRLCCVTLLSLYVSSCDRFSCCIFTVCFLHVVASPCLHMLSQVDMLPIAVDRDAVVPVASGSHTFELFIFVCFVDRSLLKRYHAHWMLLHQTRKSSRRCNCRLRQRCSSPTPIRPVRSFDRSFCSVSYFSAQCENGDSCCRCSRLASNRFVCLFIM
jgi:hypothetical protein